MFSLIKFSTRGPSEFLPKELLPREYDGDLDSIESYFKIERQLMENEYRNWFIETEQLQEKRAAKGGETKTNSSKKTTEITTTLHNLEID